MADDVPCAHHPPALPDATRAGARRALLERRPVPGGVNVAAPKTCFTSSYSASGGGRPSVGREKRAISSHRALDVHPHRQLAAVRERDVRERVWHEVLEAVVGLQPELVVEQQRVGLDERVAGRARVHRVALAPQHLLRGGGAASEEMLGPGYSIDSCSTGHTLIQTNPLLLDDELGLLARHGLEYLKPDPFAHVAFPDGRQLTAWLDRDRTMEEIARFSSHDAFAYGRMLDEYDEVKHIFASGQFTPIGFGLSVEQQLAEHPRGSIWLRRRAMSAWDVIRHEFEDEHIQAFLLWQAFQTMVPVDSAGSGQLAYSLVFGRQRRSWTLPRGGSGALTDALVRCIEEYGGSVICNARVVRLLVEGGRCTGVETEDGTRYRASEAVVSTIHVKHLLDMAPADAWDEGWRYGVETFDVGISAMAVYLATTAPPVFATTDGPRSAVSAGLAGFPRDVINYGRALSDGRYVEDPAWLLVACPTLADPSRAPAGHHTVKLLSAQSYGFPWFKEEQADRQIERIRAVCAGLRGGRRGAPGQDARGHRGEQPAHDPRNLPRRQPDVSAERRAAAGARLGLAPDADSRPLSDGRNDAPGRVDHGRAGSQRGDRAIAGSRTRPEGGGAQCRTRACSRPLITGRPASCRRGWTTATSCAR